MSFVRVALGLTLLAPLPTASACGGDECGDLLVDVRSDYVAGVEVQAIRVVVGSDRPMTVSVGVADDLLAGVRVVDQAGVTDPTIALLVELISPTGATVQSRRVRIMHTCDTALTLVLSRSCEGITCPTSADPMATECLAGVCVRPDCGSGCVTAECAVSADCDPPAAACAEAACVDGVCLDAVRPASCASDEVCVPDTGCVSVTPPMRDGGVPPPRDSGSGCTGECSPGTVETNDCGNCGRNQRVCGPDCRWGPDSACTGTDARCPSSNAPSCINDYCWGWRPTNEAALACIDMNADYRPAGGELGILSQEIYGRPGATWTKENQIASCAGAPFMAADTGVIDASGMSSWSFSYGASDCTLDILAHVISRMRIDDTAGPAFFLPNTAEVTFHNSTCTPDRATCAAASTFCPL